MQVVAFDFAAKQERTLAEAEWPAGPRLEFFHWITAAPGEEARLAELLGRLGAPPAIAALVQASQPEAHYELYEEAIHFTLAEARLDDRTLKTDTLGCLLGENFLAVLAPAASPMLEKIRRIYREDFRKFARSSGFLLYELGAHLLEAQRRMYQTYEDEAERVQNRLFGEVADEIFAEVAGLTGDIFAFRRTVLAARDLFNDLATRKSAFVAESTQPALDILADRMGRLANDLAGVRNVLNETLNLYMGMVSHRTNRIVNRLTIFSMIFLPLSFLVGVYGMNFEVLPELKWRYAYPAFWAVVAVFVLGFVAFVRRKKWL